MKNANRRREKIMTIIKESQAPISASFLAKALGVSRQVIVGDVALLRAEGSEIIATARGYMLPTATKEKGYIRKIACLHTPKQTKDELYLLVDLGVRVEDVIIEHEVYGELTGSLGIESRDDVNLFIEKLAQSKARLLSELTTGIHLHTITCRDAGHFEEVITAMKEAGYLLGF